ncbi:MAG: NUDIX hydrolase [Planctomycetaceae bacterium]
MSETGRGAIRHCPQCGAGPLVWRIPRRDDRERQVCTSCGYVHYVGPVVAAGAILCDGPRICLLRRAHMPGEGLWTFPGGFVDLDEEVSAAALREVREETGCEAELNGLVGVYASMGPRDKRVVIVVYAARLRAGGPADSPEVKEVRWFHRDALPWNEFAFPSSVQALRDFLG